MRDQIVYSAPFARCVLEPITRWGYRRFRATGQTPSPAYRAMRKLFGATDPRPFASLDERISADAPLLDLDPSAAGLAAGEVGRVVEQLRSDGYAVLKSLLDEPRRAELETLARSAPATLIGGPGAPGRARWSPDAPRAIRYDLDEADILTVPAAQSIVADGSLLAVAQSYLGAAPVQDLVAMWWSNPAVGGSGSGEDDAAQRFHFDLDRVRFLKVFVLLTDVDDRSGPHVYVRGSHRALPPELRRDGRHTDACVEHFFPNQAVEIGGPAGTVFLADTRGLHKGKPLVDGHRLLFQTEYATSLFGGPYHRARVASPTPALATLARRHPSLMTRFDLGQEA